MTQNKKIVTDRYQEQLGHMPPFGQSIKVVSEGSLAVYSVEGGACAFCKEPDSTYFLKLDTTKCYCINCYEAMGMRQLEVNPYFRAFIGPQWACTEKDTLFTGENANHPAAPVHMSHLASNIDICIRLAIRDDKSMEELIENFVSHKGNPQDEKDYSQVSDIMKELSPEDKEILFSQGTIFSTPPTTLAIKRIRDDAENEDGDCEMRVSQIQKRVHTPK